MIKKKQVSVSANDCNCHKDGNISWHLRITCIRYMTVIRALLSNWATL